MAEEETNISEPNETDPTHSEFLYYSATLREVLPKLSNAMDRQAALPWIRKLFRPEYHSTRFRHKRNKYLLYLILTLMNDEVYGIFKTIPGDSPLPDFETLAVSDSDEEEFPLSEWEQDDIWRDVLLGIPEHKLHMKCTCEMPDCKEIICQGDKDVPTGKALDEEFMFFLYLTRPFAVLMRNPNDRTKVAAWIQCLCTIQANACNTMKRIRNDYIMALYCYAHELRVAGPFIEYPPAWLLPLEDTARIMAERYPVIDPCGAEACEFFSSQPAPKDGALCYIAVTGELLDDGKNLGDHL